MKSHWYILFFIPFISSAQNWSENIAPLFYQKCTQCHHTGGIAPTSYLDYQDAVADAASIRVKVQQGKMPPWPPDTTYSRFAHERTLTQQQVDDIVAWVQNGTPEGDTLLAPIPPSYQGVAEIQNPDLVLQIPPFAVNSTGGDVYRCFALPTGLSAQRFISQLEALPGDLSVVHHVLVFSDTSALPLQLDAQDPAPGYSNFGGTGSNSSQLIGVWAPGGGAYTLPNAMGIKLPAGATVVLQVHYPGGITNVTDTTQVRFKFSATPFTREVFISSPLNHFQLDNGPLAIAPNATPTFYAHYTLPLNVTALGVAPHMHLLGKTITSYAVTPTYDTIPIIHLPNWDFHWQGLYSFPRLLKFPTGTTLYAAASYDNTLNNPNNPNDPPRWTYLGERTTDEMMLVYFVYTYYLQGDENIVQDSSFFAGFESLNHEVVRTVQLYDVFPNPVQERFTVNFFIPEKSDVSMSIIDMEGRKVLDLLDDTFFNAGFHAVEADMGEQPKGLYFVVLSVDGIVRQKKIIHA